MSGELLFAAAREGNVASIEKILKSSSSLISAQDEQGQTFLHIACSEGHLDVIKKLSTKKKAPVNEVDNSGWTIFHCACASNKFSIDLCSFLLKEGNIDLTVQANDGATAFHYLVRQAISSDNEAAFFEILDQVLAEGMFIFYQTAQGEYPLHFACMKGRLNTVKYLLEHGAKPDLQNKKGETALHYSVATGQTELIKLLLHHGANKYIFNDKGETPHDIAKKTSQSPAVIELLADSKLPAFLASIRNKKLNSVMMFIKTENQVNMRDKNNNGMTALLHSVTTMGANDITKLLLDSKADVTLSDNLGNTVLHYIAYWKNSSNTVPGTAATNVPAGTEMESLLKSIMEKGGKSIINKQNSRGETPLHIAALQNNVTVAKLLVENGAQTNIYTSAEESPLHYAVEAKSAQIVQLLSSSYQVTDKKGISPGELAEKLKATHLYESLNYSPVVERKGRSTMRASLIFGGGSKSDNNSNSGSNSSSSDSSEKKEKRSQTLSTKYLRGSGSSTDKNSNNCNSNMSISGPSMVRRVLHVSENLEWTTDDIAEMFQLEKQVGQGAYGAVYRAIHQPTGYIVAIKSVPLTEDATDIEKEISVLRKCRDLSIVSYLGSCQKDGRLWILMEYCGCGSVADLIKQMNKENKSLTESQIAALMTFVVSGLLYLHDQGVIHRDLKPANILLNTAGEAKLADFGVSAQLTNTLSKAATTIGTPLYMSPEVIEGVKYDTKADMWSLGVTLVELATGKLPYASENVMRSIGLIVNGPPPLIEPGDRWSPSFASFVNCLLVKDTKKRKSAEELTQHPFITAYASQDHRKVLRELLSNHHPEVQVNSESTGLASKFDILYAIKRAAGDSVKNLRGNNSRPSSGNEHVVVRAERTEMSRSGDTLKEVITMKTSSEMPMPGTSTATATMVNNNNHSTISPQVPSNSIITPATATSKPFSEVDVLKEQLVKYMKENDQLKRELAELKEKCKRLEAASSKK